MSCGGGESVPANFRVSSSTCNTFNRSSLFALMTASKDCFLDSGKTAAVSGGIGLVVSAMQNTIQKHHTGARGVITRTGGTIAFFGKSTEADLSIKSTAS